MILIEEEPLVVEEGGFDEPDGEIEERSKYFPENEEEGEGNSIKAWNRESIEIWNQNAQPSTYKACGIYSATIISNGQNYNEYMTANVPFTQENPLSVRKRLQNKRGRPNRGTSLQEVARFMKAQGYRENVLECKTEAEMKRAIDQGCFIHTGSDKIDWRTQKFVKKGVAHLIAIVGYDAKGFLIANSFGVKWGDGGYMHLPYGNKDKLFSTFAVIDMDSSKKIEDIKYEQDFQAAIAAGITNGSDPDQPASRKMVSVMIKRALDSIKK